MSIKQASTRFSIVKRSQGQSAVEKASYISRTELFNEYDGKTYRPKYHEDLVHSEISLPENAPAEFADRATLWNSVEQVEKGQKAQLARMMKASLPNDWSYEVAVDAVRDYVNRNFVSKGMCADWAIHDSENEKGERNLHFHLLLTIRPLEQDGTWGAKQRKVYLLDKDGNKIRNKNGKGYKCTTEQTTDWNNKDNAKIWRKDLADTVNAVNEQIGLDVHWEHRSFKDQGIDLEPTIHLGEKASALERKGIPTERGNINREIIKQNNVLEQAKAMVASASENLVRIRETKVKDVFTGLRNEVTDMIDRVLQRKGRLDLPIVSGKYLAKVTDRSALQSGDNAKQFVIDEKIENFEDLAAYSDHKEKEYDSLEKRVLSRSQKIKHLKQESSLYAEFSKCRDVVRQSQSLKGKEKVKFDSEHKEMLESYPVIRDKMKALMQDGETLSPAQWNKQIKSLQNQIEQIRSEQAKTAHDLASAEVIAYNKANLDRELSNESHSRGQHRQKNKTEEL